MGAINFRCFMYRAVHWFLMVVLVIFLITGFGISEFKTVERLTLGLLTKQLASRIHSELWFPFIVLLILHVYFVSSQGRECKDESLYVGPIKPGMRAGRSFRARSKC